MSENQNINNSQQSSGTAHLNNLLSSLITPGSKNKFLQYFGSLSALFLFIQFITGILLTLYYKPTPEDAFSSIKYINDTVYFGAWIRSLHHFSANALIVCVLLCSLIILLNRVYKKPFAALWYTGISIVFIILLFAFTGQVLPWNELSYFGAAIGIAQAEQFPVLGSWAAEILRGGKMVGSETLGRMFTLHTIVLPLTITSLVIYYFIQSQIISQNYQNNNKNIINENFAGNNFIYKILITMICGTVVVSLTSLFIVKSTGIPYDIYNPSAAPPGIHPDWYFMWLYQTLKLDTFIPSIIIFTFIILIFLYWMFIAKLDNKFTNGRGKNIINVWSFIIIIYMVITTIWGYINSGISANGYSMVGSNSSITGGIDSFSFAGIILFTSGIMILLIYTRIKSVKNKENKVLIK